MAVPSEPGALLTLDVLRAGSNSLTPQQLTGILPAVQRGGPSVFEVLLQVDEKSMLAQHRGQATVSASVNNSADHETSTSQLLGVSPVCLCTQDGSAIKEVLITGRRMGSTDVIVRARCQGNFLPVTCGSIEQDETSPGAVSGQQCVSAWIKGVPTYGGLVLVELQQRGALSGWKPLVVVPSQRAAMEINRVQSNNCSTSGEHLVADMGRWLDYVSVVAGSGTGHEGKPSSRASEVNVAADRSGNASSTQYYANAAEYRAALAQAMPRDRMLATGLQLLGTAADRGWPHTSQMLLQSLLAINVDYDWVVGMIASRGPSLLQRAVRSKSIETVQAVYNMGEEHSCSWKWDAADKYGITPLHVAAVLPDDGSLAETIIKTYPMAARLWQTVEAYDGMTPAKCAARCGRDKLNDAVQKRLKELATPFNSKQQEDDEHGMPQRMLDQDLPSEVKHMLQQATTRPELHASVAAALAQSEVARRAQATVSSKAADETSVTSPPGVLDYCLAGRFPMAAAEMRYQAHRTVQGLRQDQLLYPLLVGLLLALVTFNHLKQGGRLVAVFTLLLSLAGQLSLTHVFNAMPGVYLRRRREIWLGVQLVRPVLLLAVAGGILPLPLTWTGPSVANTLSYGLLFPCLEHLSICDSAVLRTVSLAAEVAVAVTLSQSSMWADMAHAAAVAACGVVVSGLVDYQGRATFLETTKID